MQIDFVEAVKETSEYIGRKTVCRPKIAVILGSGLGKFIEKIEVLFEIEYSKIPNFPVSTVEGHRGRLIYGKVDNIEIVVMDGRFHFYEGYSMKEVTYPIYVLKEIGIEKIIVSNAAGGINKDFSAGDLMIIEDHINLLGTNPLIGKNYEYFGKRFPDMSEPYNEELIELAKKSADKIAVKYKTGVYIAVTGPSYETKAEIRYLSKIGADAVGMSTVPEVLVANYLGMKILGISCITNMATGIAVAKHSHEQVVKTANEAGEQFCSLVIEIVKNIKK